MKLTTKLLTATAIVAASGAFAEDLEVMHWWTSGGEAAALNVLKQDLEGKGIGWADMPVAGGGGTGFAVGAACTVGQAHRPAHVTLGHARGSRCGLESGFPGGQPLAACGQARSWSFRDGP